MEGCSEGEKKKVLEGEVKTKRKMKTASQLEILEKSFAVSTYPSEALRAELSEKLGLSDRQLQMWFCHRRLKDRKPPSAKRPRKESSLASTAMQEATPAVVKGGVGNHEMDVEVGNENWSGSGSGSSPFGHVDLRRTVTAAGRFGTDMPAMRRYYNNEPAHLIPEIRAISFVEAQLGQPLREDGPILGMEFDSLPPDAFGAPIVRVKQKQSRRAYESKLYDLSDTKSIKGPRALHEYQFLPEQPTVKTESYERISQSHYYGSPSDSYVSRTPALPNGHPFLHGNELVSLGYDFQCPSLNHLPQQNRQGNLFPSVSAEYDTISRNSGFTNTNLDPHIGSHPIDAVENPFLSPEGRASHDDDASRIERKRKNEESRIAREVEAHEKRIRKELEKQVILRRKREDHIKKETERHNRERRKEDERLLREKLREEERLQREQKRELERREKFLQKETIRAEKIKLKEDLRREKEAARLKAANDRATARRLAKESMELIEDGRLELMELAASSKGLPSILSLDAETLQNLELFSDMLAVFPPKSVRLTKPFSIKPWADSEKNVGSLLMVWRFLITFADVLGLWPFTLDEFVQAFHDYDPRLLSEIHVALLRSIIKDIEDVARAPSTGMGVNQNCNGNPGGGHPHIIEGAYAWGFDIRSWQRHLNPLTWPEILRQFALVAGFGPQLKKRDIEEPFPRDYDDGNNSGVAIFNLRNGVAAENAAAIMQERGFSSTRRTRHCLTPGTVKFAAFHVLSLEGSRGLSILEVADRIQKSGLRDLTTSKTPEASIAAALSRDVKLFERTAPSTYCVRSPYRKDPVNADSILSEARERVQIFKNGFSDGEEAEAENVERDEDSGSDAAEDQNVGDFDPESNSKYEADAFYEKSPLTNENDGIPGTPFVGLENSNEKSEGDIKNHGNGNGETEMDEECYPGETWVQGLMEGEYSDLSVEERLNALVALVGVAIEGNSIRIVLEERLDAANALKKQMWAEAQVDKRRIREDYVSKMQYLTGNRVETIADEKNEGPLQQEPFYDPHCEIFMGEKNAVSTPTLDFSTVAENLTHQQPAGYAADKSQSQLKSFVTHKAEEMYVYRSLPLGQDRRRNRYWQFITSSSRNDPCCGRIFIELSDGSWRLIASEEGFDALLASLDTRGIRESNLHMMLQRIENYFKETLRRKCFSSSSCVSQIGQALKSEMGLRVDMDESPSSTVCGFNSDASEPPPPSSLDIVIELGLNEIQKCNSIIRYQEFEKWMWQECLNPFILGAMKYGKKRCIQLLGICDDCHDVYLSPENYCPYCKRSYDDPFNFNTDFSEQVMTESDWMMSHGSECSSLPLRLKLLKAQLVLMEVSILPEALSPEWTEGFRNSWGRKLHASVSPESLLQIVSALEGVINREFVSSSFATTSELLKTHDPCGMKELLFINGNLSVLPWIPHTTAAVALRLMEIDASIFYTLGQKYGSQKDIEVANFTGLPSGFNGARTMNTWDERAAAEGTLEGEYVEEDKWMVRGGRSGGRGRGRGRRGGFKQGTRNATRPSGLLGWKGHSRGRGRRRGRQPIKTDKTPLNPAPPPQKKGMTDAGIVTPAVAEMEWGDFRRMEIPAVDGRNSGMCERWEYEEDDYNGFDETGAGRDFAENDEDYEEEEDEEDLQDLGFGEGEEYVNDGSDGDGVGVVGVGEMMTSSSEYSD